MNDYSERITSNLISALSAMTAAFVGTFIGFIFMWGSAHDALDIAKDAAGTTEQAQARVEQAEYELKRLQEQYDRDVGGLLADIYTCERRTWDIKAHCPLYVAP